MEENEEDFFSIWSEVEDRREVLILWNRNFPGDPVFNHATRISCLEAEAEVVINYVLSKFTAEELAAGFYVSALTRPQTFEELLPPRGLRLFDDMKVMEFMGYEKLVHQRDVETVKGVSSSIWARVFNEAFRIPRAWRKEVARRCSRLASDPRVALFAAYLESKPVGTLALHSEKGVSGIYCVGTVPEWRRSGVASALLRSAVAESQRMGNEIICLQTLGQDQLERFYRGNGFSTAFSRRIYLSG